MILASDAMVKFWESERFSEVYGKRSEAPVPKTIFKSLAERLGLEQIMENTRLYELWAEQYDAEFLGCFKTLVNERI